MKTLEDYRVIMDMNILVGIHLHSTENTSLVTQGTDWAATTAGGAATAVGGGIATAYNAALGGAGTFIMDVCSLSFRSAANH